MADSNLGRRVAELLLQVLEHADAPPMDLEGINALTAHVSERLGFQDAGYYQLSTLGRPVLPIAIFGKGSAEWIAHYQRSGFHYYDPAIQSAFRSAFPFTLQELEAVHNDSMSQRVFEERRVMRSQDALICPIFGPVGERGCLTFLSDARIVLDRPARFRLKVLADVLVSFHQQATGTNTDLGGPWPSLSPREAQCLYWSSQGKSAGDTAAILGISAHTVRGYIESTMEKLGARNREEMMLSALALGLLVSHR